MNALRPSRISFVSALLLAVVLVCAAGRPASAADLLLVINQVSLDRFPEVTVYFTAVDSSGLPITDISKDRIQVLHNGKSVPDVSLQLAEAEQDGLAVAVAVDVSGSMKGKPLDSARGAVRTFMERMGPRDKGAVISFGEKVTVVQDLTNDRNALNGALDSLVAVGNTTLYDGIYQAIQTVSKQALGRRAVVVITDGEDTHSSLKLEDVIDIARKTNTPVSVIALGQVKMEPMERLVRLTGGSMSVAPSDEHLQQRTAEMSDLLRKQYVLRYQAPDSRTPDNEVELVLNQNGVQIRSAQRFVSPPMPPFAVSLGELVSGSKVRGPTELKPTLPAGQRVDRVEYLLDGAPLQTVTTAPYAFTWDTSTVAPGDHTVTVKARVGDQETQQSVSVTVVPPIQLAIKLPSGQDVSGPVKLVAEVDSLAPVVGVGWAVDGQPIGTSAQAPFEIEWDSTSLPPGEHMVTAEARDDRGGVGRASQPVRVLPAGPGGRPAGVTPGPGSSGGNATPKPGTGSTPTVSSASTSRTPTATATSSTKSSGLGSSSTLLIVGGIAVVAIIGGIVYMSSRGNDERETMVVGGELPSGRMVTSQMANGPRVNPTFPGFSGPPEDDFREAETTDFREAETRAATVPPGYPGAPTSGMPGQSMLTVAVAGEPPRQWPLGVDQIIGRSEGPGIIVVVDKQVSRRHARISWENGHFVYRDLGPLNPTRRDGRTLPNPYILRDGDHLKVGTSELMFRA